MTTNTEQPDLASVDEALTWASTGNTRVWGFLDALLDERLNATK